MHAIPSRKYITRLSAYRNALKRFQKVGFVKVFSDNLADAVGVSSAQVRKDFSLFGITGYKKGGYKLDELLKKVDTLLGKDRVQKVIVVGAGNIGTALMNYKGFRQEGIEIVAAFDVDTSKTCTDARIPVLPAADMPRFVKAHKIPIAILAVPEQQARECVAALEDAGIRGILNFAPIHIRTRDDIIVSSVNLRIELENLIYFISARKKAKKKK